MRANLIKIGNSKGVRIPKPLLEEAGLEAEVDMKAKRGEIRIVPVETAKKKAIKEAYALSYSALAREWNTPEEDEAWAHLQ